MALQAVDSKSILDDNKKTGFTYKGAEIVLSKTRGRPFNEGKGMFGVSDNKRIEVVTAYAVLGNVSKVSELSGISAPTIRQWRKEVWFKQLLDEIRDENDEKIDVKFNEIVEQSLDLITDRLQGGDYVVLKSGELIRKPVGVRDLALVAAITIDKRQLLRGKPTSRSETVTNQQQLERLAEQFTSLATKGKKPLEIQDVPYTEVKRDHASQTRTTTEETSSKEGFDGKA